MPSTRRRRLLLFFVCMWLPWSFRCRPVPCRVTRNRFAEARWVFIFGISALPFVGCGSLGGGGLGELRRRGELGWVDGLGAGIDGLRRRGGPLGLGALLRLVFPVPLVGRDHHAPVGPPLL